MRAWMICLALIACDNSTTTVNDLSMPGDLSASRPDRVIQFSCKDAQTCIQACTAVDLNSCVPNCIAQLSTAAQAYFGPLETCSEPACTMVDGGPGPCVDPGSAACTSCVTQNCAAQEAACLAH